ncbi:MAG: lysyl oxidase family protein [Candidatus Hydrogenedentes bacterium]|nr:lysyl oxidase family protein [Candidatus Hydrogenedentota bacterium]
MKRVLVALAFVALMFAAAPRSLAQDLLPDLIVNPARLMDHEFVNDIVPGRIHILLSNSTPNIGDGELRVVAGPIVGDEQTIFQAIKQADGSPARLLEAGVFVFHGGHGHVHVNDWAQYRILEVLPGDGVGAILFEGAKTSFCLVDSMTYAGFPGTPEPRTFVTCSDDVQGITVGWEDIYYYNLPDQWIDITGLTPGEYWLESEVDPEDHILETDETNNRARIKLVIAVGELPLPDEIPLHPRLPWVLSFMILLCGVMSLCGASKRMGERT